MTLSFCCSHFCHLSVSQLLKSRTYLHPAPSNLNFPFPPPIDTQLNQTAGPFSLSSFSVYLLSKTFIHLSSQCLVSLCVTSVAYPQSLPFAPHVLWTSSSPPSVTLPLLFPSSIHPSPAPLPDTSLCCVLSGCVYLPLHFAVFTASIHLCLFSPAAPSYIKSGRDITHTQTQIHNHPDARI